MDARETDAVDERTQYRDSYGQEWSDQVLSNK